MSLMSPLCEEGSDRRKKKKRKKRQNKRRERRWRRRRKKRRTKGERDEKHEGPRIRSREIAASFLGRQLITDIMF